MSPDDKMPVRLRSGLTLAMMLAAMARPGVAAETCRAIEALPATITDAGRHCLTADTRSGIDEGAAIIVMADWVTLDLHGYRLIGTNPAATAIEAVNRRGVTIRDGTIGGFGHGIRLSGRRSGFHVVERLGLAEISGVALRVDGRHNIVRNNHLTGSTERAAAAAWGIIVRGPLSRVLGNNLTSLAAGIAVEVSQGDGAIVEGNVLAGGSAADEAIGVRVVSGSDVLVLRNELRDLGTGVVFGEAAGVYQGNVTRAVGRPYVGGTDADHKQ